MSQEVVDLNLFNFDDMKMEYKFIPCCYYPTQIVFVDDDERFLKSLIFKLGKKFHCRYFTDLFIAAKFFDQEYKSHPFTQRCLLRPEEEYRDHRSIDVNIRVIHEEIFNPRRFDEVSVAIIDYSMPSGNGLELCQQLKNSAIKKIVLTGEADEKLATAAFNKGLIQQFIRKDSPNLAQLLIHAIETLQKQYFFELSEIIINSLTKNSEYPPSCLDDPEFIMFFEQFCQQKHITEYYLLEATGSFIFLDSAGKPSLLIVKDEDAMAGAVFEAEMSDEQVPEAILDSLKNKEKLLYLPTDADYGKSPIAWTQHLYSAQKLSGKANYYYTFIPESSFLNHISKIVSYKNYLGTCFK
jgi:CheY-like chemotaxis protein